MIKNGYLRSSYDSCVYIKWLANGVRIFLLLYVDMLLASVDHLALDNLKKQLSSEFEMKDLGEAKRILGMEIVRDKNQGVLKISQKSYLRRILDRFDMKDAKPIMNPIAQHFKSTSKQCPSTEEEARYTRKVPYANAVGCLMYSMICTRPNLAYATSLISRFMANPGREQWKAVKWVFRYLRRTSSFGFVVQEI